MARKIASQVEERYEASVHYLSVLEKRRKRIQAASDAIDRGQYETAISMLRKLGEKIKKKIPVAELQMRQASLMRDCLAAMLAPPPSPMSAEERTEIIRQKLLFKNSGKEFETIAEESIQMIGAIKGTEGLSPTDSRIFAFLLGNLGKFFSSDELGKTAQCTPNRAATAMRAISYMLQTPSQGFTLKTKNVMKFKGEKRLWMLVQEKPAEPPVAEGRG